MQGVSRSTENAPEPSVQSRNAHSDSPGTVTRSSNNNQTQQSSTRKDSQRQLKADYAETFSPTADLTNVRVVLQKAAQENLLLHQMDVKTMNLHTPIDFEIHINPPEGYQEKDHSLQAREIPLWS